MTYNSSFELPAQRFGDVVPHDRYTPAQLDMFKIIDGFGKNSVSQIVELDSEPNGQVAEVPGQYL